MNGAILGMTRAEVSRKLDEIVDFSGCERYLDTPVKRYSSGMMVRLGFAVAAHLDPEILVVDEVLAVGDAEFQKKAIGKMKDVSQGEGRTVLFVSHNMAAVKMLCNHGVVLKNGSVDYIGGAEECVDYYLANAFSIESSVVLTEGHREDKHSFLREVEFVEASILNDQPSLMACDETLRLRVLYRRNSSSVEKFQCNIIISNAENLRVAFFVSELVDVPDKDTFTVEYDIPNLSLPRGKYRIRLEAGIQDASNGVVAYDHVKDVLSFEVKFRHQNKNDEFLFWQPSWGLTFREDSQVITRL